MGDPKKQLNVALTAYSESLHVKGKQETTDNATEITAYYVQQKTFYNFLLVYHLSLKVNTHI